MPSSSGHRWLPITAFCVCISSIKCTSPDLVHQRNFLSICGISCCNFFFVNTAEFHDWSFQKWIRHVNYTVICLARERSGQWLINYIHQRFRDSCKFKKNLKKQNVTSWTVFFSPSALISLGQNDIIFGLLYYNYNTYSWYQKMIFYRNTV